MTNWDMPLLIHGGLVVRHLPVNGMQGVLRTLKTSRGSVSPCWSRAESAQAIVEALLRTFDLAVAEDPS